MPPHPRSALGGTENRIKRPIEDVETTVRPDNEITSLL
jgi:hypothetical protein